LARAELLPIFGLSTQQYEARTQIIDGRSKHVFFAAQRLHAKFVENFYFLYNIKVMDHPNINLHTQAP
jgi:hypothetical protein